MQSLSFPNVVQRSQSRSHDKNYGTIGKVLSSGTHMPNMSVLSLTVRFGYCFTPYQRLRLYNGAPFSLPFTTRWGYGGRILGLNPGVPTGELGNQKCDRRTDRQTDKVILKWRSASLTPQKWSRKSLQKIEHHLESNFLHNIMQSAHRSCHSTETAPRRVNHDIKHWTTTVCIVLVILDLLATFDVTDHDIMFGVLNIPTR